MASACQHGRESPYPLGIYGARDTNTLMAVRNAGFNMVVGTADATCLNAADRLGLKVIANPGTSAGQKFSASRARQVVHNFDQHPALWAWYLSDEPDLNQVSPEEVRAAARTIKTAGAHKPTALVLYQGTEALNYSDLADITMLDRYPVPWLPLANFPQHVRMARLALGRKKPLLAVIQAFDWTYYPELLPGKRGLRPPTEPELRCMSYSALARGATGLFYYCYDDGRWQMPAHPETWIALQRVVAEVKERQPLFEADHPWWSYRHEYPDSSGFNEALESSISSALLQVRPGSLLVPPGDYLLTVNTTDQALTYRIRSSALTQSDLSVVGEARHAAVIDGWLEDKFGPFDVHIYGPISRAEANRHGQAGGD